MATKNKNKKLDKGCIECESRKIRNIKIDDKIWGTIFGLFGLSAIYCSSATTFAINSLRDAGLDLPFEFTLSAVFALTLGLSTLVLGGMLLFGALTMSDEKRVRFIMEDEK